MDEDGRRGRLRKGGAEMCPMGPFVEWRREGSDGGDVFESGAPMPSPSLFLEAIKHSHAFDFIAHAHEGFDSKFACD